MGRFLNVALGLGLLAATTTVPAQAQKRIVIRIEADPGNALYRFVPARVTARPGDILVFRATRGGPHNVSFEAGDLSEATHEAINGAMGRKTGDLSSPLLTTDGAEYRIVVPRVQSGVYHFYCLPHRAYDERGELRITK